MRDKQPGAHNMEPVTQGQFFQSIEALRALIEQKHTNLRETLEDNFKEINAKLADHAEDDQLVANRVLTLEVERKKERESADKELRDRAVRLTAIGLVTGGFGSWLWPKVMGLFKP